MGRRRRDRDPRRVLGALLVDRHPRTSLIVGEPVTLEVEAAQQDGYDFRALEIWRARENPDRSGHIEITEPSDAYRSTLFIAFDRPDSSEGG